MRTPLAPRPSVFGLVVLAGLLLGACAPNTAVPAPPPSGDVPGDVPADSARAALEAARARWQAAGLTSYHYVYAISCFCPPEARAPREITVENGEVVAVTRDGEAVADGESYPTIDSLFGTIERALDDGAAQVRVTYDPEWGYPTDAYIDLDAMMADEELGFRVSGLTR